MTDQINQNEKNEQIFIDYIEETTNLISGNSDKDENNLITVLEKNTDYDIEKSKEVVKEISETIDLIADNFEDLKKSKGRRKVTSRMVKR